MAVYGKNAGPNFTLTDGNGNEIVIGTTVQADGSNSLNIATASGGTGSAVVVNNTTANPVPVSQNPPAKATPTAGAAHSITTGGTAQNAVTANSVTYGGYIRNPYNATESLYVDPVNAAQIAQNGGTNGTSIELAAGDTFYLFPSTVAVSVNATTSAHAFTCVIY